MDKKYFLFITEGQVTEVRIIRALNEIFIQSDIEFLRICTNIYHLYHAYLKEKEDVEDEIDMFIFLKQYDKKDILKTIKKNDIRSIYLFMDLDAHEPLAERYPECLPEMFELFNNETENGKLYVSYPMVEAFQHPLKPSREVHSILPQPPDLDYKSFININKSTDLSGIKFITKENWINSFIKHLKTANFLINENLLSIPNYDSNFLENLNQKEIYKHQLLKFIEPNNHVLVLSPFALFLIEYLGEPLFKEWKAICENES